MNKVHHYTECGLMNVYIEGVVHLIDEEGDEIVKITAINQLHRVIAMGIVNHEKGMSGDELRFLRTEIGLTQSELAKLVHCDKQTIGRWERSENAIDGTAETLIRRLAIEKLELASDIGIDELSRRSVPSAETQTIEIRKGAAAGSYELIAA